MTADDAIIITGADLTVEQIAAVVGGVKVAVTGDATILDRLERSRRALEAAIERGEPIYGVSTLFGAMADRALDQSQLVEVQRLALWQHKTATGPRLPEPDVRAAMLLRANSLLKGASAIRLEIIERYVLFLNAGAASSRLPARLDRRQRRPGSVELHRRGGARARRVVHGRLRR